MLLQRVITAVVLLIIIIGALLISPLAFTAVAAIAIGCCFWEWLRICKWNNGVAMVCGVVLGASLFFLEYASPAALQTVQSGNGLMIITATATVLWAVITAVIFTRRTSGWMVPQGIGALLGWIFVPAAWFSLMYLFREKGTIYMLSVLAIVWVADIMAYFGGRCFGGPKMAQGISPKKTWSGALTAFVCVLALSYVLYWAQPSFSTLTMLFFFFPSTATFSSHSITIPVMEWDFKVPCNFPPFCSFTSTWFPRFFNILFYTFVVNLS